MLSTVRASLTNAAPSRGGHATYGNDDHEQTAYGKEDLHYVEESGMWDHDANEMVFDDTGEGMGVEGDLDVEDD